ncbi:MAG: hypothetical protein KGL26_09335 [Pseudomonadota bacterium]|nr:hypothetical protein [Pseudomonadota bacterium]
MGEIGILNVGAGDTKLTFDKDNPAETIRAGRIVKDMLRRGYALLVEVEPGKWRRALDFDPERCCYIIADFDGAQAQATDARETNGAPHEEENEAATGAAAAPAAEGEPMGQPRHRGRSRKTKDVPAAGRRGVAVARSAGG